ncbi:MAG: hypothetical protein COB02_11275 [Candidatus Cloacimonadota bacterium]|nr:MAG: hypothetical protein COB02_11275 [Candidatus Cloacimonadota bacterium]
MIFSKLNSSQKSTFIALFLMAFISILLFFHLIKSEKEIRKKMAVTNIKLITYELQNILLIKRSNISKKSIKDQFLKSFSSYKKRNLFIFSKSLQLESLVLENPIEDFFRNKIILDSLKDNKVKKLDKKSYIKNKVIAFSFYFANKDLGLIIELSETQRIDQFEIRVQKIELLQTSLFIILLIAFLCLWLLFIKIKNLSLSKKMKQEKYLSHVSHEIRTPLNGILGFIHLLLKSKLSDTQKQYLMQVKSSSENLLEIVNRVLDYSKLKFEKLEIKKENFLLEELFNELYQLFYLSAQKKEISLNFDLGSSIYVNAIADKTHLRQVLINLLGNSIKFTNKGKVSLKATYEEGSLKIIVSDTGIGIDKNQISTIFDPYVQESSIIESKFGGTGLGLSISKELLFLMNGKLSVKSKKGEGTSIEIMIPIETHKVVQPKIRIEKSYALICNEKSVVKQLAGYFDSLNLCLESKSSVDDLEKTEYQMIWLYASFDRQNKQGLKNLGKQINHLKNKYSCSIQIISSNPMSEKKQEFLLNNSVDNIHLLQFLTRKKIVESILTPIKEQEALDIEERTYEFKKKILLIEDDLVSQFLMKEYFSLLKLDYDLAVDGEEALYLVQLNKYDCILLDFKLPKMSGIDLTSEIKKSNSLNYETIIIGLTANTDLKIKKEALEAGMNVILFKPIRYTSLVDALSLFFKNKSPLSIERKKRDFNQAEVFTLFKDDKQGLFEIVENYLFDGNTAIELIDIGIKAKDKKLLEYRLHKLKGSSATFNFHEFISICKEMEMSVEKNNNEFLNEQFEQLKSLWVSIEKSLKLKLLEV